MHINSSIDRLPIKDTAKTILDTDDGDVIALFTSRMDYAAVGRTRIRINGDEDHELEVPIEALRQFAAAALRHAEYLDKVAGHPAVEPF